MAVRNSLTHTGGGGDTKGVARELDTSAPVFVFRLPPFLLFLFLSLNKSFVMEAGMALAIR
jgi:hypothetical protein